MFFCYGVSVIIGDKYIFRISFSKIAYILGTLDWGFTKVVMNSNGLLVSDFCDDNI
jgi:hypothetical protein